MELKEMIKVMQHYENGGKVESRFKDEDSDTWRTADEPSWNWKRFDYRIKEQKQKVTIEKWLCEYKNGKNLKGSNRFFIIEKAIPFEVVGIKIKLLETYEVEL